VPKHYASIEAVDATIRMAVMDNALKNKILLTVPHSNYVPSPIVPAPSTPFEEFMLCMAQSAGQERSTGQDVSEPSMFLPLCRKNGELPEKDSNLD
jgi:hypothetical protein